MGEHERQAFNHIVESGPVPPDSTRIEIQLLGTGAENSREEQTVILHFPFIGLQRERDTSPPRPFAARLVPITSFDSRASHDRSVTMMAVGRCHGNTALQISTIGAAFPSVASRICDRLRQQLFCVGSPQSLECVGGDRYGQLRSIHRHSRRKWNAGECHGCYSGRSSFVEHLHVLRKSNLAVHDEPSRSGEFHFGNADVFQSSVGYVALTAQFQQCVTTLPSWFAADILSDLLFVALFFRPQLPEWS